MMRNAIVIGLAILVLEGAGCRVRYLGNEGYDLVPITEPRPTLLPIPPTVPTIPKAPWSKPDEIATTIWERDTSPKQGGRGQEHPGAHELVILQIDLTETSLLFHFVHKQNVRFETEFAGTSQTPTVTMLLNSCPVDPPAVFGTVTWNGERDEIVAVQRERLPRGDLNLDFRVFDIEAGTMFMNYDSGFRVMTDISQSRWYETIPAPPGGDEMGGATLNYPKNCGVE